jgi:hypothetical protein
MNNSGFTAGSPCGKTSKYDQLAAFRARNVVRFFRTLLVLLAVAVLPGSNSPSWIVTEAHAEAIRATNPTNKPNPTPAGTIETRFQYAVKAACGNFDDTSLSKGIYHTAINVHNPTDAPVDLAKKVALAAREDQPPGRFSVTPFHKASLNPDAAFEIDCPDIANFFCPIGEPPVCIDFIFIKGFVVINSPVELDVVAVYTARHSDGEVETMSVNQMEPKKVAKTVKVVSP